VRARGYASARGEIEVGLKGVAAPIRDASGVVVAAVSVGGPAYRVTPERLETFSALVVEAAARISVRLGSIQA
jgi:DNA-binding IclR family transcriptional regulator